MEDELAITGMEMMMLEIADPGTSYGTKLRRAVHAINISSLWANCEHLKAEWRWSKSPTIYLYAYQT